MKLCIIGAGSVGGYLGGLLARHNEHDVTLVARGEHLRVMQQQGLTVTSSRETFTTPVSAVADTRSLPVQDAVFLCVKTHQIAALVPSITPLLGPQTTVISVINGVPWWYFHASGGALEGQSLESVDPGRVIWNGLGAGRALGCVPYVGCAVTEPGTIRLFDGYNEFHMGDPQASASPRCQAIVQAMQAAGIVAIASENIRTQVWRKLLGNVTTNPISVLANATMDVLLVETPMQELVASIMQEAMSVAQTLGVPLEVDIQERLRVLAQLGHFKTSMLQDYEAGKPIELEPIVGSVREIARRLNVPAPLTDTIYALLHTRLAADALRQKSP